MEIRVYGRTPRTRAGRCYRIQKWAWRPIHALMVELCSDLLDDLLLERMRHGGGAGPDDQVVCDCIAERFNLWMEHHVRGARLVREGTKATAQGSPSVDAMTANIEPETPYRVSDEQLKGWVEFLGECGGFEVC